MSDFGWQWKANPLIHRQIFNYPQAHDFRRYASSLHEDYRVQHHIGIDTSPLFVARIGARNDNNLVWVGRDANYLMWVERKWTQMNDKHIYHSTRWLRP